MINRKLIAFLCLTVTGWSIGSVVFDPGQRFFVPYYTEAIYKNLENLYNASQYRQKEPTALIADDVVFRYAAGAYLRGVDPILVNSEHTPLGKYLIGASYVLFQNDRQVILLSALLALYALWLVGVTLLRSSSLALIPVALFATEKLFRNQLIVTPLLDIIQLPWILLSLLFFLKGQFFFTALSLGLVMATKSVIPAVLLVLSFAVFLGLRKKWKMLKSFLMWFSLSFIVLIVSYAKTFQNGYSFSEFIGFQKWIILYQQSKLIFPLSFWRLTILNQWQTWWGEMKIMPAEDWWFTWPILVILPFILLVWRKNKLSDPALVLVLWAIVYEIFLSLGIVSTRFFLPLLPTLYVLLLYTLVKV